MPESHPHRSASPLNPEEMWGLLDALATAYHAFECLSEAKTLPHQGHAIVDLSNAMSDLVSWHPKWDWERGVLGEQGED